MQDQKAKHCVIGATGNKKQGTAKQDIMSKLQQPNNEHLHRLDKSHRSATQPSSASSPSNEDKTKCVVPNPSLNVEQQNGRSFIAYVTVALSTVGFVPMLYHIWCRKSSCDLSLLSWALRILAACGWMYFGIYNKIWPTVVAQVLSFVFGIFLLSYIMHFRKNCPERGWAALR